MSAIMDQFEKKIYEIKNNKKSRSIKLDNYLIELSPIENSKENIRKISKWRKDNQEWFLTKFTVTDRGTEIWLNDIWNNPQRILFFIIVNKKKIGHIGIHNYNKFAKSVDIDSVLKGDKISEKRIMEKVFDMLFYWIFNELKMEKIQLEVFSDNYKAINLYERTSMLTINSFPIRKIKKSDGYKWNKVKLKKGEIGQRYLNQMCITKEDFLKLGYQY